MTERFGNANQPRAYDLGIPFAGQTGRWNAITDVSGVEVGHTTLLETTPNGAEIRTGVTVVLPQGRTPSQVPAAFFSLNGFGEMTGTVWLEEGGWLDGPVALTNTYSVGTVQAALREWAARHFPRMNPGFQAAWELPVVGETYDGLLNDIDGFHIKQEHVFAAIESATTGPVTEGSVGGGTGMVAFRFKGGIGTSSRLVSIENRIYTVGVLVQANFGERVDLMVAGVPVGLELTEQMPEIHTPHKKEGSIIVVVATDAPLLPHQLKRLAKRVSLGLARVGGMARHSSGDIFLAFSTARPLCAPGSQIEHWQVLGHQLMDPLFVGVVQATEEAILNAMIAAETMIGYGNNRIYALPHDALRQCLSKYGRLQVPPSAYL